MCPCGHAVTSPFDPTTKGTKKPIRATFKEPMESHGRDRDDGFRNPPGTEVRPCRSRAEARRTPPRVRPLMEIVGSDEQMASMGFALALAPCGASEVGIYWGAKERQHECMLGERRLLRMVDNSLGAALPRSEPIVIRPYGTSPRCPTNWSSLSSKSTLKVVRLP